jgi:membrane associated rhomboid family serine protease
MFLPIGDVEEEPLDTPFVTFALLGINILVFILLQPSIPAVQSIAQIPPEIRDFYDAWAVVPARISEGDNWISLLSSMFLHGGWLHLGSNMLYLWIFGDNVEHAFGPVRFLLFYLASGVAASALQIAFLPESTVWNLGASGAIAGVLAAYMVLFPKAWVNVLILFFRVSITRVRAVFMIGAWFVLQLISGGSELLSTSSTGGGGVAYWAHVGGFLAGLVLVFLLGGRTNRGPVMAGEATERGI